MLPTYEAQKEVLSDHRGSDMEFLGCALRMGAYDLEESDEEMADVDSTLKTAGPLTSRGSLGPNDAWLWAYHSEGYMRDYHAPNKLDLREWCYCLWDRRRLSACGILSTPWSEERHYQWIKVVKQECNRRFEENARSLKERSDITMMDGAGYWTKDWSKIIWPSDHSPCRKLTVPREYEYIVDWRPRKL